MKYINIGLILLCGIWVTLYFSTETNAGGDPFDEQHAIEYLMWNSLTHDQATYIVNNIDSVRSKHHVVAWFGAIFRHENGAAPFVDWQTNYLAWRLKRWMEYKPFTVQFDWWVGAYNKYWYRHDTIEWRLDRSRYCVSDSHGGGEWCPNWRKNVPQLISKYWYQYKSVTTGAAPVVHKKEVKTTSTYVEAKQTQDRLDTLRNEIAVLQWEAYNKWKACKDSGECTQ